MKNAITSAAALLVAAFLGCTPPQDDAPQRALIGPEGGELVVRLSEGEVTVRVPRGALREAVELTGRVTQRLPGAVSPAVELGPEGTTFDAPVRLDFRPGSGDVAHGVPRSALRVATVEDGRLRLLPSEQSLPGVVSGWTPHFSQFALVAQCRVGGTGRQFALTGCESFNPSIDSDTDLELIARAGRVSLQLSIRANASGGRALLTVSGLPPSTTWYLRRGSRPGELALQADPAGRVQLFHDVSAEEVLNLASVPGSVDLTASSCVAPIGTFNAATRTCRLMQDIVGADVSIFDSDFTLDCRDPQTNEPHRIGSSAAPGRWGVAVFNRANVRVLHCKIENVDVGVQATAADGLRIEGVSVGADRHPGTAFSVTSSLAHFADIAVQNYSEGLFSFGSDALTVRRATFSSTVSPMLVFQQTGTLLDEVTLSGARFGSETHFLAALSLDSSVGTRVSELRTLELTGYDVALAARFDSDVEVVGAEIDRVSHVAIRLDGPGASVVRDSNLSRAEVALELLGGPAHVFHNNVTGSTLFQAKAAGPTELSDARPLSATFGQGNFWGRTCPNALFVPGVDSNRADVVDTHPFSVASSWKDGTSPGCAVPPPVITRPVDGSLLADSRPTVEGMSTAGSTVQIKEGATVLATTTAAAGTFLVRLPEPLADGPHFLRAQALVGPLSSLASSAVRFVVDTRAPAPPAITFPAAGSVLFASQVTVGGRAEAEAVVRVYDGQVLAGETRALADGSFELAIAISAGSHALSAAAEDAAGNVSLRGTAVAVTVQQASPQQPISGVERKMFLTRLTQAPNPFTPSRGETTLLDVAGFMGHSTGNGQGHAYELEIEQQISRAGGPVLRTLSTRTVLPRATGGTSPFSGTSSWDGKANTLLLEGGTFVLTSHIRLLKTHRVAPTKLVDHVTVSSAVTLNAPGGNPTGDYLADPALDSHQRLLLRALELSSAAPIFVQTWPRAGTVYRVDLEVASGAPASAPLSQHAMTFISRNLALWRLPAATSLSVFEEYPAGACSAVVLQLQRGGVPVFNATLTVLLTPSGTIRSVIGRMSGEPFDVQSGTMLAAVARDRMLSELKWEAAAMPLPVPAIFDTFFAYDGPHRAQEAWLFNESSSPGGGPLGLSTRSPTGVVVGAVSGRVEVGAPAFGPELTALRPFKCGFADSTLWAPEVVLDPLTQTAAWINLHHMSGVKVSGLSDVDRAYAFLELDPVKPWWGTNAPREHLREARVQSHAGGVREVTFREYQAGIPVDGAYLSLMLDSRDRVVSAQARFVPFPRPPAPSAVPIPVATARAAVQAFHVNQTCGSDIACRAQFTAALTDGNTPGELVLLSPAIYEGWSTGKGEQLAWRFELPGAVVYWDALANQHLLAWRTGSAASFWYQVWAPDAPPRGCRGECIVPAGDRVPGFRINGEALPGATFAVIPFSDGGVNADTARVAGFVEAVDSWFVTNFQWRGPAGDAGFVDDGGRGFTDQQVLVDAKPDGTDEPAISFDLHYNSTTLSARIAVVAFGLNAVAQDIYAHEFMHAPTRYYVGYPNFLEHGALNESISDLAAIVSTPPADGGWDLGLQTIRAMRDGKATRNVLTPRLVDNGIQHVSEQARCDTTQTDRCNHEWVGIPNRAAGLIAEGLPDGGGRPFGRLAMADLMLSPVLQRRAPMPHRSDRFINQLLLTLANCKVLAARVPSPDPPLKGKSNVDARDCDFIEDAYREVGVEGVRAAVAPYREGWKPEFEEISLNTGRRLRAGCTIREHVLTLEVIAPDPAVPRIQLVSSSLSIPPLTIQWPNDPTNWQVRIAKTFRGADTDATDRSLRYSVEAKWLTQPFVVFVDERFNRPASVPSDLECVNNPGTFEVELWSTPIEQHWAHFLNGDDGNSFVNDGGVSPCAVVDILGVHQHRGELQRFVHPPLVGVDHGNHGFFVTPGGAGPFRLDATLRWFHNGNDGIFARVAYLVEQPLNQSDPGFCVAPGTMRAPVRAVP